MPPAQAEQVARLALVADRKLALPLGAEVALGGDTYTVNVSRVGL